MHGLHLLRHAKASRDEGYEDHERPLSRRGREDARRIGAGLPSAIGEVDLVLCSTAQRTRETAALALAGFAAKPRILFEDVLYLASAGALLRRLYSVDETVGAVLVIGHNPGLQELAIMLADPASASYSSLTAGRFPTGVRASFAVAGTWQELGRNRHELTAFAVPNSRGG